jgi:heme exporter protein C
MALVATATFLWLPPVIPHGNDGVFTAPDLARIIVFHLPNSFVVVVAALVSGWHAYRYLVKGRHLEDDIRSKAAASLAGLFCVLTTITGSIFAKSEWGSYWNWDPKQICIFLLLLIYAAYFVLRAGIEDPEKQASLSAVYDLFAVVMTPTLGYAIPKYMASQTEHPTNTHFDPSYSIVIIAACAGFLGLYLWMQNLAVRLELVRAGYEAEANPWDR